MFSYSCVNVLSLKVTSMLRPLLMTSCQCSECVRNCSDKILARHKMFTQQYQKPSTLHMWESVRMCVCIRIYSTFLSEKRCRYSLSITLLWTFLGKSIFTTQKFKPNWTVQCKPNLCLNRCVKHNSCVLCVKI